MRNHNYLIGIVTGFALGCLYMILPNLINSFRAPQPPQKPQSNFEVIATYDGCDIVKMERSVFYESQYFMRCSK